MKKYDCVIGIDPGVQTGFAVWLPGLQKLHMVETFGILDAFEWIQNHFITHYENVFVRIENPNLRKWFGNSGREVLQGAGSVKRDYRIWQEFLESRNIPYEDVAPKNIKTKVKADYFKKLTGWQGRTSSHGRDAALLCFKYQ